MKGLKLLVVDHDVSFVDYVVTALKKESVTIFWVSNSRDVMARVEYLLPDVVILAAALQGFNTLEILVKIKSQRPLTEVIIAAEQKEIKTAIEGMRRGAADYIKLPAAADELVRKIKIAYQKKLNQQKKISRFENILA